MIHRIVRIKPPRAPACAGPSTTTEMPTQNARSWPLLETAARCEWEEETGILLSMGADVRANNSAALHCSTHIVHAGIIRFLLPRYTGGGVLMTQLAQHQSVARGARQPQRPAGGRGGRNAEPLSVTQSSLPAQSNGAMWTWAWRSSSPSPLATLRQSAFCSTTVPTSMWMTTER